MKWKHLRNILVVTLASVALVPFLHAETIPSPFDVSSPQVVSTPLVLTEAEQSWLTAHPVIRLSFDPSWPPFSFRGKEGQMQGLDVDFIHLVEAKLGRRFELCMTSSWPEVLRQAANHHIDCISGTALTPERARSFLFTDPYLSFPIAIITRNDAPFLTTLSSLRGQVIAMPKDYVTTERLRKEFANLPLVETQTSAEALLLVSRSRADAVVENLATCSYLIKNDGLTNLKISGLLDDRFDLRFAIRTDWPELRSILNKASTSITAAEWNILFHHWILVDYPLRTDWAFIRRLVISFFLIGALLTSLFAYWNRRLARELAERCKVEAELRTARDRLEHMNEEKSRFMGMAAHDLNTPLTEIIMQCDVLKLQKNVTPQSLTPSLDRLQDIAFRMSRLIRNLLNATAIEQGKNLLKTEHIDLSQLARGIVERFAPSASQKQIRLHFHDTLEPCYISADLDATTQILDNLLSNAVKYTPPGKMVHVTLSTNSTQARCSVQDEGPGLLPDEIPFLFGSFTRLSAQPTGNETSHGLGLSIVKQLAEAMHARVWCESVPGQGAHFHVEFSLARA